MAWECHPIPDDDARLAAMDDAQRAYARGTLVHTSRTHRCYQKPSALALAGKALHAAGSIAKTRVLGLKVLPAVKAKRLAVCADGCPACVMVNGRPLQCRDCGCFLQFKADDAEEVCPRGLWPKD